MSTVVAIDGPAGAGKSTVARLLAERMGYAYVNTGSLYRALALSAKRAGIDPGALTAEFLAQQQLEFKGADLYLNGILTGAELRTPDIAQGASLVSKQKSVRDYLLPVQRNAAKNCWIVMEGRDIGTVIFPDAKCKFFVTATPEERVTYGRRADGYGLIVNSSRGIIYASKGDDFAAAAGEAAKLLRDQMRAVK